MSKPKDEVEVTCPVCKTRVAISVKDADEKMKVVCPKGHEIPLVKAI